MADLTGFNAAQYDDDSLDLEPIKPGVYKAVITESQMMDNSKGTGKFLMLTLQIIEGEFKNRRVWDRLNLIHPNETAVEIAKQSLANICRAVGVLTPRDSAELHDKPMSIRVVQRKREDNGEIANDVKAYAAASKPVRIESGHLLKGVEAALAGKASKRPQPTQDSGDDIPF